MIKTLNDYANSVTSQFGEDGILLRIFEILSITNGQCVEFGAWDGKQYSNTYNLINNYGWNGVLIEGSQSRFEQLKMTYAGRRDLNLLNTLVGFDENNKLDALLKTTKIYNNFDLLSVDVDGNDYHIWSDLNQYRPKVVVIEINPTIPNNIHFVQERNMAINQGSSLLAMQKLGCEKGYELLCCTLTNAVFVDKQLFSLFGVGDNTLDTLYPDKRYQTQIFQLFDGTIKIAGCDTLLWHQIKINEEDIQVLSAAQRVYPGAT